MAIEHLKMGEIEIHFKYEIDICTYQYTKLEIEKLALQPHETALHVVCKDRLMLKCMDVQAI